jgi:hypothetical protein
MYRMYVHYINVHVHQCICTSMYMTYSTYEKGGPNLPNVEKIAHAAKVRPILSH